MLVTVVGGAILELEYQNGQSGIRGNVLAGILL
jgi:hypothetical protein